MRGLPRCQLFVALLGWLVQPLPTWAFGSCTDPAFVSTLRGATPTSRCEERAAFSLVHGRGTSAVRVVSFTSSDHEEDAAWIGRVERNLDAIGTAMRSMGAVGTYDITVVLVGKEAAERNEGETSVISSDPRIDESDLTTADVECEVSIYKVPPGFSERHLDFLFAHEIFHCAQVASFGVTDGEDDDWWVEGSAEHFGHMAVPDFEDPGWYRNFDVRSTTQPLTAMEYENVVFFHWLQMHAGPEGLGRFLTALGAEGDAALQTWVDTAAWSVFTEAFLDGSIQSPGGRSVPRAEEITGFIDVEETYDLQLDVTPYVVSRCEFRFAKEKHFDVQLGSAEGAQVRMQDNSGTWSELPLFVSTCPEAVTRLAYAVTADAPTTATINFVKSGVDGAGACCLEGEWTPTPETLAGVASQQTEVGGIMEAMYGVETSCTYTGGSIFLRFQGDGRGSLLFDEHASTCVAQLQGNSVKTSGARSGSFEFNWSAEAKDHGSASFTDNSVIWTVAIHLGPVKQIMPNPDAGPGSRSNAFAFACTDTTLDIRGLYGLGSGETSFTRPPPVPAP